VVHQSCTKLGIKPILRQRIFKAIAATAGLIGTTFLPVYAMHGFVQASSEQIEPSAVHYRPCA
jgi:hypothetical protein